MPSRLGRTHGFTLLEVLVAMAVFGIGIVGFIALQTATITARMHAQLMTTATQLTIAQLNALMINVPATGTTTRTMANNGTQFTQQSTVGTTASGLTTLQVTTSWKQKGPNDDSVTLSTVLPP